MGLLKTVFEVNLGLFGKKTPDGYVVDSALMRVVLMSSQPESPHITPLRYS